MSGFSAKCYIPIGHGMGVRPHDQHARKDVAFLNKYLVANASILAVEILDLVFLDRFPGNFVGFGIFDRRRRVKMVKHGHDLIRVPDLGHPGIGQDRSHKGPRVMNHCQVNLGYHILIRFNRFPVTRFCQIFSAIVAPISAPIRFFFVNLNLQLGSRLCSKNNFKGLEDS
jgi:hypothetical protein